jgi:putative molybdopterin biosynthesis protein
MQKVFKPLVSVEEALKRLEENFKLKPLGFEEVSIFDSLGRVLAEDVISNVDVPGFDRATMDGFAVKAKDTFGADEENPVQLKVIGTIDAGQKPDFVVNSGEAAEIATGAPIPQGANAVVMEEYCQRFNNKVNVFRSVVPNENIMAAGTDIMAGELVLREGQLISPREMGVLAALGIKNVKVYKRPLVGIISTGEELVLPGRKLDFGKIYDINSCSITGAVKECGAEPIFLGIVPDNEEEILRLINSSIKKVDVLLTSGSTSAGTGDLMYRVLDKIGKPGVIVHGLALKPGKPTIIAVVNGKLVIGLPGYPASALMIFTMVVRPILLRLAGLEETEAIKIRAKIAERIECAKGRRELIPVHLIQNNGKYYVYEVGLGSGAISSLSMADGYVDKPIELQYLERGEEVEVNLFGTHIKPSELVIIGSHDLGIDVILQILSKRNEVKRAKVINVGSMSGFFAVKRGEADLAGVHLLDEQTGKYNIPFVERLGLQGKAYLVKGYERVQGLIVQKGNPKKIKGIEDIFREDVRFMNRNKGSGTRILLDTKLKEIAKEKGMKFEEIVKKVNGYDITAKSHSSIAVAILNNRIDVGLGIETVAKIYNLGFIPLAIENYDFLIPKEKMRKKQVLRFLSALKSKEFKEIASRRLQGIRITDSTGKIIVSA